MQINDIINAVNITGALVVIAGALTLIALKMDDKSKKKNHHR